MSNSKIQMEKKPLDMLPEEIWVAILDTLDTDTLLICRRVCSEFTKLVNSTDQGKFVDRIWNAYFVSQEEDDTFVWCDGNQRAISKYLESGPGRIVSTVGQLQNVPESIILYCHVGDPFQEYAKLCKTLPRTVSSFGESIKHITMFIHDDIPESYQLITTVLLNMKNLKSLTLFCYFENMSAVKNAKKILKCHFDGRMGTPLPPLPHFTDLAIFGNERVYSEDSLVPFFIFGYGVQIRKLYLGGTFKSGSMVRGDPIMESFPNVEQLKVGDTELTALVSLLETQRPIKPWPMLQRISIKVTLEDGVIFPLHEFFRTVLKFSGSLESFHLQIDQWHCLPIMWHLIAAHNFPKVRDVRLPFHFVMDLANRYTLPMHLNQIRDMWPNIKTLYLIDMEEYMEADTQPNYDQMMTTGEILQRLWNALPASLEKITVRYKNQLENGSFQSVNLVYWKM